MTLNDGIHCLLCLENPREFLIEQLEQLKVSQQSGVTGPNLFDNTNLEAVFRILDPANQKHITFSQYKQGDVHTADTVGSNHSTLNSKE